MTELSEERIVCPCRWLGTSPRAQAASTFEVALRQDYFILQLKRDLPRVGSLLGPMEKRTGGCWAGQEAWKDPRVGLGMAPSPRLLPLWPHTLAGPSMGMDAVMPPLQSPLRVIVGSPCKNAGGSVQKDCTLFSNHGLTVGLGEG